MTLAFTWDFAQLSQTVATNMTLQQISERSAARDTNLTVPTGPLLSLPYCNITVAEIRESTQEAAGSGWSDFNNYTLESHITSAPTLSNPCNDGGMPSIPVLN